MSRERVEAVVDSEGRHLYLMLSIFSWVSALLNYMLELYICNAFATENQIFRGLCQYKSNHYRDRKGIR